MPFRTPKPFGDIPPRTRAFVLWGSLAAAVAVLVLLGVAGVSSRRTRQRLERDVVLLQKQLTQDRRSRLAFERDIAAERRRLTELSERHRDETKEQLETLKAEERRIREELAESRKSAAKNVDEIRALEESLNEGRRQLRAVAQERTLGERIIRRFQAGVGLVEGSYRFVDPAGRPLREAAPADVAAAGTAATYTVTGDGPIVEEDFTGTGFLVSRTGLVLTNRHVAEPWWKERGTAELAARGLKPRLTRLRIFFPGVPEPFDVSVLSVSTEADVALVRVSLGKAPVPALEVEVRPGAAVPGQPVVLLGYPAGIDALLARLDEAAVKAVMATAGASGESLALTLSRRKMIRPLATQGHLGDVLPDQLVYDAQTTVGGSGGPVFSVRGKVIGVNAAIMTEFTGASFGVPIRFGQSLVAAVR